VDLRHRRLGRGGDLGVGVVDPLYQERRRLGLAERAERGDGEEPPGLGLIAARLQQQLLQRRLGPRVDAGLQLRPVALLLVAEADALAPPSPPRAPCASASSARSAR